MPGFSWKKSLKQLRSQFKIAAAKAEAGEIRYEDIPNHITIEGRTAAAIRSKLTRLKLWQPSFTKKRWTEEEDQTLGILSKPGKGAKRHKPLRRHSKWAITNRKTALAKAGVQGLVDPRLSQLSRNAVKLRGNALEDLENAIHQFSKTRSAEWFTWKFGIGERAYRERRDKVGITLSKAEAYEIPSIKSLTCRKMAVRLLRKGHKNREELKQRMLQKRIAFDNSKKKPTPRKCKNKKCEACESGRWYETTDFFLLRPHSRGKGQKIEYSYSGECAYCVALKRSKPNLEKYSELIHYFKIFKKSIGGFEQALARELPEFYSVSAGLKLNRKLLEATFHSLTDEQIIRICKIIVGIYISDQNLDTLFTWLEKQDFSEELDLHIDIWDLDEIIRRDNIVKLLRTETGFSTIGQKLVLLIFRCLGLPRYVRTLF